MVGGVQCGEEEEGEGCSGNHLQSLRSSHYPPTHSLTHLLGNATNPDNLVS